MDYISEDVLNKVVNELTTRANNARKARALIGMTIISVVAILSAFMSYRLTDNLSLRELRSGFLASSTSNGSNDTSGIREAFNLELSSAFPDASGTKLLSKALSRLDGGTPKSSGENEELKTISKEEKDEALSYVSELVDYYVKVAAAENGRPVIKTDNTYSSLISTLALSAGAVGFVLYILQIAVSFIRYYSRLAELYDSQRTALIASGGNVETAKILMDILSNDHIGLGKEPVTLYGKALDVIGEVAKSK